MSQAFFHTVFIVVFAGFTLIRMYYHRKAQKAMGKVEYKEGRWHVALRLIFGLPFMLVFAAYLVWPGLLAWAEFPLPAWAQWLGVVVGVASLPLIAWVQWALDTNFSTILHVREDHTLITRGPYRWVRHPMYTVLYVWEIAILLLTRNWFIGGFILVALTLIVVTRLQKEEAAVVEKFGDEYRAYMQRTGRFLPRLS